MKLNPTIRLDCRERAVRWRKGSKQGIAIHEAWAVELGAKALTLRFQ